MSLNSNSAIKRRLVRLIVFLEYVSWCSGYFSTWNTDEDHFTTQ